MAQVPLMDPPSKKESQQRLRAGMIVAAVSLASIAVFVFVRLHAPTNLPTFFGACTRIKESGIPPSPGDWWCSVPGWYQQADVLLAALVAGVGYALPPAILASTGRRATALVPLLAVPFTRFDEDLFYWVKGGWLANTEKLLFVTVVNLAVLAAPAIAIMLLRPARRIPRDTSRNWIGYASLAICALAAAVVAHYANTVLNHHFGVILNGKGLFASFELVGAPAATIWLFGALLGTHRKLWPWALAVVALFLSHGLSGIVETTFKWNPEGAHGWPYFGFVIPLFAIGIIGSVWQLLARRLSPRSETRTKAPTSPAQLGRKAVVAGKVALNAFWIALLAISLLMFAADPEPSELRAAWPTYLGERTKTQDTRTNMDLHEAITTADQFQNKRGTFQGFSAETGASMDPNLAWANGIPEKGMNDTLVVHIASVSSNSVRVAARSGSGTYFCVQRTSGQPLRYGSTSLSFPPNTGAIPSASPVPRSTIEAAAWKAVVAKCGAQPWTSAEILPPPPLNCIPREPGFLICRMVQVLDYNILRTPKP